jgi:quercetin dioxygenase-like cupin family protein
VRGSNEVGEWTLEVLGAAHVLKGAIMGVYRLYTGADGESHIDELKPQDHPELREIQTTSGIRLQEFAAKQFIDWHPAPRRQWVIILSGELEIGLGDGTFRRFGPGDARLVEDTTGRGHTTRTLGDKSGLAMAVHVTG